jgi:Fe-S cluster assembly iron-binding protein IscA
MTTIGTVGNSSMTMPFDMLLRRGELSSGFFDKNAMDDYHRETLKDMRSEAPLFESDLPRHDYHSEERLNLRYNGKRSETEAYAPEGAFLGFDHFQKDKRSLMLDPDFTKARKQYDCRKENFKLYPDGDLGVSIDGPINPGVMVTNIKNLIPQVKQRFKNFSTSLGNMVYGYSYAKDPLKRNCLTTMDGQYLNLNDAPQAVRSGATVLMSNNAQVGWRTTTDNTFKVAKYGMARTNKKLHQSNPYIVQNSVNVDHKMPEVWENLMISPALALKIVDLAKQKYNSHLTGMYTLFGVADVNYNKTYSIPKNAFITEGAWRANNTQNLDLNTIIGNKVMTRKGGRLVPVTDSNKTKKAVMSAAVIDHIAAVMSNRKLGPKESKDLRAFIEQSATDNTMWVTDHETQHRKTNLNKGDTLANRNGLDVHAKQESFQIFNYKNAKPMYADAPREMHGSEAYKTNSSEQNMRTTNLNPIQIQKKEYFNADQEYGQEYAKKRNAPAVRSKYTFNYNEHETPLDEIGESSGLRNRY